MKSRRRLFLITSIALVLCVMAFLTYHFICNNMFTAVEYDDLEFAKERGLFHDLDIKKGSCVFEIPPSLRSPTMFLFHSIVNFYGVAELSDDMVNQLLQSYMWEKWVLTEEEWKTKGAKDHMCPYLFEFENLQEKYVNNELWVCEAFDAAHMHGSQMSVCYSYLDPLKNVLLFFYHSS